MCVIHCVSLSLYIGLGAPNGKFNTTNTEIYLTELQPDIRYRVQIKAENMLGAIDVTSVRDDNISFTTLEGGQSYNNDTHKSCIMFDVCGIYKIQFIYLFITWAHPTIIISPVLFIRETN